MAPGRLLLPLVSLLLPAASLSLKPTWPPLAPDPDAPTSSSLPVFNITSYGAVPDNSTLCTSSIQAAIDAAAAAGGGLVRVPPGGAFRTGALQLASNVYLYVPDGATLQADYRNASYVSVAGENWDRWDVLHTNNASNTGIVGDVGGSGVISGPMWQMIDNYDPSQNQLEPVTWAGLYGCEGECRPRLAVFEDCENVVLANVRLEDSADWTTLFRRVRGLTWANVTVWGSQQWPNNDGVDLESCSDVYMGNVSIFTGDDSICLASGNTNNMKNPWPEPAGNYTPCANVLVENVTLSSYSSAFKLEAIFQASHGHVENVTLRNARILASNRGIGMQQRTGYGAFRNISFVDVSVEARAIAGTNWWGLGEAVWLTTVPENDNLAEALGGIHGVSFVNVDTVSEQGVVVAARNLGNGTDPSPAISGLSFQNVTVVVAALGNETRSYGVHDFRPLDVGQAEVNASVSGYWFEHLGPTTVSGGGVFFAGPAQPAWEEGVCRDGTPDSVVSFSGVACEPAGGAV